MSAHMFVLCPTRHGLVYRITFTTMQLLSVCTFTRITHNHMPCTLCTFCESASHRSTLVLAHIASTGEHSRCTTNSGGDFEASEAAGMLGM